MAVSIPQPGEYVAFDSKTHSEIGRGRDLTAVRRLAERHAAVSYPGVRYSTVGIYSQRKSGSVLLTSRFYPGNRSFPNGWSPARGPR